MKSFMVALLLSLAVACAHAAPPVGEPIARGLRGQEVVINAPREIAGAVEEYIGRAGGVVSSDRQAPIVVEVQILSRSTTIGTTSFNPFAGKGKRLVRGERRVENTVSEVRVLYRQQEEGGRRSSVYLLRYRGDGAAPEDKRSLYSSKVLAVERALGHLHGF